jgi:hypothetical protein
MFLLHGDFADLIPKSDRFFLIRQKRMIYIKSKDGFDIFKRELQRLASVRLKMFPQRFIFAHTSCTSDSGCSAIME